MIVRLPREKLHRLQREISKWAGRRSCSKRELLSLIGQLQHACCTASITSEASGSWGCGAFSSAGDWFQLKWPGTWSEVHITVKELLPCSNNGGGVVGQELAREDHQKTMGSRTLSVSTSKYHMHTQPHNDSASDMGVAAYYFSMMESFSTVIVVLTASHCELVSLKSKSIDII